MKFNFSYFFIKFVYYTYLVGFALFILDIPGFFFTKGNIFMLLPYIHILCPFAGVLGLIPAALVFFVFVAGSPTAPQFGFYAVFIPYIILFLAIFLQKKVVDGIKVAIEENLKKAFIFKIVILHHLWTGVLFTKPVLSIIFPASHPSQNHPISLLWSQYLFLNFLIALGVWRWVKSE